MHMNGPSKFSPKPSRHAAFFCSLFLLCVHCIFNMETESVTRLLNPRWSSSINMPGRHANHISSDDLINASRFLPPPLLCRQGYFILIIGVHLQLREQVSRTIVFGDPTLVEGE
jgi:hypothetical protein